MTNEERIQANNAELRECIEIAENLPEVGDSIDVSDYLASRLNGEIKTYTSDKVTTTPNYAFYNCASLEHISLPSCTWVATAAFQNCTSLKSINFPSATKGGGTCFRGCSLLTNVNMPLTTELSTYAFAQCSSLKNIDLPSFTTLGGAMFQDCTSLERANIPMAKSIGAMCFQRCSALAVVIIKQTTAVCSMAAVTAFEGTPIADGTGYVYVPRALVDAYKSATNWTTYAAQIRAIEDYPEICG